MATTISDFFSPEISSKYFLLKMLEKSSLIKSGIAVMTPELNMASTQPGSIVNVPSFNQLIASDAPTIGTDTTATLAAFDLSGNKAIARKNYRNASWKAPDLITYTSTGLDVLTPALNGYVDYWAYQDQLMLVNMLTGAFITALSANVNNIAIADGVNATADNLIGSSAVLDAQFLLGDQYSKFGAIAMHSVPFSRLVALDLISYVPTSVQNPTLMPTYLGMQVIVDDALPKVAGGTSGYIYTSYLFGRGSVGYSPVPIVGESPAVELYREPLAGGGSGITQLITRNYNIITPVGCSFTGSPAGTSPTNAEYATSTNWALAWEAKRITIAQLKTNG